MTAPSPPPRRAGRDLGLRCAGAALAGLLGGAAYGDWCAVRLSIATIPAAFALVGYVVLGCLVTACALAGLQSLVSAFARGRLRAVQEWDEVPACALRTLGWLLVAAGGAVVVWRWRVIPYLPGATGSQIPATRIWGGACALAIAVLAVRFLAGRALARPAPAWATLAIVTLTLLAAPASIPEPENATHGAWEKDAPGPRRATGLHVTVIGIDGGTWTVFGPLMAEGRMPHLAELARRGAHGKLKSIPPFYSPSLWPTIDTGVSPPVHGLTSYAYLTLPGVGPVVTDPVMLELALHPFGLIGVAGVTAGLLELTPATSGATPVPRLWNRLDAMGGTSVVVGWHATWPAPAVRGIVVSDRALEDNLWTLFAPHPTRRGLVHPAGTQEALLSMFPSTHGFNPSEMERFFPIDDKSRPWLERNDYGAGSHDLTIFKHLHNVDINAVDALLEAKRETRPELAMVLLDSFDFVAHAFWNFHFPPPGDDADPEIRRRYAGTMAAYCEWLDEKIGALAAIPDPEEVYVVVSDHGMRRSERGYHFKADHDVDGIWLAAGGPIRALAEGPDLRVTDVAPLVAYLLGLPPAPWYEGKAPGEIVEEKFRGRWPVEGGR